MASRPRRHGIVGGKHITKTSHQGWSDVERQVRQQEKRPFPVVRTKKK